ncbi:hypothetical protein EMIHUDRAFT_219913 [Emiliania huxleyi CCMP1516]|uniref:Uncharacterized protein n=2 Tax=Emiliania huxleyi TaxID=2903 RepID=A0A0D3I3H0_EMIH1|nr:hypothetical protein EMIHUDRAFT_219913 [Emiliania huxleyi CCMP1516]EOD05805.1 hypothetical protein EMIHUDRAFT_219913 [Emiliania huxleyi CCMP1516]|eukprot:XP_005758234.1 hypothetical protein EMIHUDRAFT_219913 [Emiliania huxleyi CCMP1516]
MTGNPSANPNLTGTPFADGTGTPPLECGGPNNVLGCHTKRCKRSAMYAMAIAEAPDDPAGDDRPQVSCIENMLELIAKFHFTVAQLALQNLDFDHLRKKDTVSTRSVATTRSSTLLYARRAFLFIPLGSLGTVAADFEAPSSDDVDELGRSRGSQMTSHASTIG